MIDFMISENQYYGLVFERQSVCILGANNELLLEHSGDLVVA